MESKIVGNREGKLTNDRKYPYIGIFYGDDINNDEHICVLFRCKNAGSVISVGINNKDYKIGDYSETWQEQVFDILDRSKKIMLQN